MRKDVRFGLAIGGSLLALLVICAALFDRGPSNTTSEPGTITGAQPGDSQLPQLPVTGSTGDSHIGDLVARTGNPATHPAGADNNSSGTRDWTMLLETGDGNSVRPATRPIAIKASYTDGPTSRPAENKSTLTTGGATGTRTHTVAAGETLITIAAAMYGDGKYYMRLEEANPTVNPNRLHIGTILNVPALGQPIAAKSGGSQLTGGSTAPLDSSKSYRVRPSDTLMSIARRLYGDGQAWEKIYSANRDVIGANPARLQVGMVLRLPSPPTAAPVN